MQTQCYSSAFTLMCTGVGIGNRRIFVGFLFSATLACSVAFFLSIIDAQQAPCNSRHFIDTQMCRILSDPLMFISTWLNLLVVMFTGPLLYSQLQLVGAETTTFEILRGRGNRTDFLSNGCHRSCSNILSFLWTGRYLVSRVSASTDERSSHHKSDIEQ
jgi:hypothetical protein